MSRENSFMGGRAIPNFGHGSVLGSGYVPNMGRPIPPNLGMPTMAPGGGFQVPNMSGFPFCLPLRGVRPNFGIGVCGLGLDGLPSNPGLGVGNHGFTDYLPPILNPADFPSLISRSLQGSLAFHEDFPPNPHGSVGMVKLKESQAGTTTFKFNSEDFPPLLGFESGKPDVNGSGDVKVGPSSNETDQSVPAQEGAPLKSGGKGKESNIPEGLLQDQYGMAGFLASVRAAETDPNLAALALGIDLTSLGLDLNTKERLLPSFGGPFAEGPIGAIGMDYPDPMTPEYNTTDPLIHGRQFADSIRDKLLPLKVNGYKECNLFYMFYNFTGDILQATAAFELYNRDWRFHMEEKIWITRPPGIEPVEKGATFERGTYYFFDPLTWRKVSKEFYLEYDKLEGRPVVPAPFIHAYRPR